MAIETTEATAALVLVFEGRATIRANVDPVAFFAGLHPMFRSGYLTWDPAEDETWEQDEPAWRKPYAYLAAHFIDNTEIDAGTAAGFKDDSDFDGLDDDRVQQRAGTWVDHKAQTWTEDDYRTLIGAVPWLAGADDPETARELARTTPIPGDQPLFDIPGGDSR